MNCTSHAYVELADLIPKVSDGIDRKATENVKETVYISLGLVT